MESELGLESLDSCLARSPSLDFLCPEQLALIRR